ncbi:MAG: hypothetical protein ACOY3P_07080 [Planctomycetota bacterium]
MRIVALTPTFRRRRLLQNAIACFEQQTHGERYMLIGDDSGEHADQEGDRWTVWAMPPQQTLPAKYNTMAAEARRRWGVEAVAVFEDDDIYLPRYLERHCQALAQPGAVWSHGSWVWTEGARGQMQHEETANARLHGALAMRVEAIDQLGGWPATARMDFDLHLLALLRQRWPASDPCVFGPAQYVFRWQSTQHYHGQAFSVGPHDDAWLQKAQAAIAARLGPVTPQGPLAAVLDADSKKLVDAGW